MDLLKKFLDVPLNNYHKEFSAKEKTELYLRILNDPEPSSRNFYLGSFLFAEGIEDLAIITLKHSADSGHTGAMILLDQIA